MSENLSKLQNIISQQLGVKLEDVQLSSSLVDDLNADSLDVIELFMSVEEDFEVEIPDAEAERATTVQDVLNLVDKYVKA